MSAKITTRFGAAVPPAPRHSVTCHMPTWDDAEKFAADPVASTRDFTSVYPRLGQHPDILKLSDLVLQNLGLDDKGCLLFSSIKAARECVQYLTSSKESDELQQSADGIYIKAFFGKDHFFAVLFPPEEVPIGYQFWRVGGVGMSSRFAEANLCGELMNTAMPESDGSRVLFVGPAHTILRERIVNYLRRAVLDPSSLKSMPSPDDVYLYTTGMSAIYRPHQYMLQLYGGTSISFGMPFITTMDIMEQFGPGYKLFGRGDERDMLDLKDFLEEERQNGRKVQAIWTEFLTNPLGVAPDITRLRELADEYDIVLGIDDTIGSWANIDIIGKADILMTSLAKTFNGYADAIAGSAILNPASRKYKELKPLFDKNYFPELYYLDAEAIERNSRDYLSRTTKLNHNARTLATYLLTRSEEPNSPIVAVYYPSINPSRAILKQFMRPATEEFTPGYGCIFTIELRDIMTASTFYDNLNVHKGGHVGAPSTLAFPFTMGVHYTRLPWAEQYGFRPTQVRISAGLEETDILIEEFRLALEAVDALKTAKLQ
ncbi:hypothetical protein WAI453_011674 [Rhynchosporium graminicola]|uniref:Related to O-succinylhomoserine (Thiol)-lyase n=1 Tax=Rhynchosporium graminicola TaxID=2792576 RepID=A0A1E1K4C3_9HELO|nr:related to O-succinylhomoserine (thiol)-lyase [Rhynchosporium commune]